MQQSVGTNQTLSTILRGMQGARTTLLSSGCWYSATPVARTVLSGSYTNVGLSPNGRFLAVIEGSVLDMRVQRNESWMSLAQLDLSTSDPRLSAPFVPLYVTNDGTILLINQYGNNGVVAVLGLDNLNNLTLNSVASYYRFTGNPRVMRAALNHRRDTLLLGAELSGRVVPLSKSLPPSGFEFDFGMTGLAFGWSPDDAHLFGLFTRAVRTYVVHSSPKVNMQVVGRFIQLPYIISYGSIVVDDSRVYVSLQANSSTPVELYYAALDNDGQLLGDLVSLAITGTMAPAPLVGCNDLLLVPLATGLQVLRKTPLGLVYIATYEDIDWTESRVVAVDSATCQTTLWTNASLLTINLDCIPPPHDVSLVQGGPPSRLQPFGKDSLLVMQSTGVSVAWSDGTHLQHHPVLTATGQGIAVPANSQGSYAISVLKPAATLIFGFEGTVTAVTPLFLDAPFNMAYTNTTTMAVGYTTLIHFYAVEIAVPTCSLSLVSETCPARGPPLAMLPAANNTLVVLRDAACDSVWVVKAAENCYQRRNTELLAHVEAVALNPSGSSLYIVTSTNTSVSLHQLSLSTLDLVLIALPSITLMPPFTLAVSTSLFALAAADSVYILSPVAQSTALQVHSELAIAADDIVLAADSLLFAVQRGSGHLATYKLRQWVRWIARDHACLRLFMEA
jgi:hypothetical protein